MDVNGRYVMILFQQFVGSDHQVVFRLSFDGRTLYVKCIRSIIFFSSCHFQCILQVDGVENGFQVVVTVGTFFNNIQTAKTKPMDEYGHLQPQAPELEEAVLGALMIEKDAYSLVSEILRPESFYEHRHQLIYAAITDLAIQQKPIDILTVAEQLRSRGNLEEAGGPFYITQLSGKVASSAHIEYHARIIAQKFLARELISFTSNIQTKAFDETQDVDDLMQEAEGKLFEISQQNMKKDYTQINPVIQEAYEMLQKAAARTDGLSGLSSGFHQLDKMTSGWQNSDLIIIAARPAMGKTAFVLSMAKNMAVNSKVPVALFSLEMSNVQLVNRLIVNVCEIPGEKIKSGQLAPY